MHGKLGVSCAALRPPCTATTATTATTASCAALSALRPPLHGDHGDHGKLRRSPLSALPARRPRRPRQAARAALRPPPCLPARRPRRQHDRLIPCNHRRRAKPKSNKSQTNCFCFIVQNLFHCEKHHPSLRCSPPARRPRLPWHNMVVQTG